MPNLKWVKDNKNAFIASRFEALQSNKASYSNKDFDDLQQASREWSDLRQVFSTLHDVVEDLDNGSTGDVGSNITFHEDLVYEVKQSIKKLQGIFPDLRDDKWNLNPQ